MKIPSKLLLTIASVIFTGAFGFLKGQGTASEKLHKRVYEHYDKAEIDLFKTKDVRELNWYMTQSFIIDKSKVICADCPELKLDTFDVIRYDSKRTDDGRVVLNLPGTRYPLILFSKNEVLDYIHGLNRLSNAPTPQTNDTTIVTCNTSFYDPGGQFGAYVNPPMVNNFSQHYDTIVTFCSGQPDSCFTVNFSQFSLSDTYCGVHDVLIVYDGPDTNSAWIGNFSTTLNIPSNMPTTFTSTTGCLTFQFITDTCSQPSAGWEATLTCTPCANPAVAQPSCSNVDFEAGTLAGWTGTTGTNYATVWTPGIVPGRHSITSGVGVDPYGGFPIVAPGGSFSAQLGNDQIGAQSEQLYQKFHVAPTNPTYTYQYAAVLQNPLHAFFDQPFFKIEVFDSTNHIVVCGTYYVIGGQPGFQSGTNSVTYKSWSFQAVDLISLVGQDVTIRFTTGDCSRTGHFGYAYLDCTCNLFQFPPNTDTALCPGEVSTLSAPPGYQFYSWIPGGQTTQSITVNQPGHYCVVVNNTGGCAPQTLCADIVQNPTPVADFAFTPTSPMILEQQPVCFTDLSTLSVGTIVGHNWDFGDPLTGTDVSTVQNPCYTYTYRDSFCVMLTVTSDIGCVDTAVHCLEIVPDSIHIPNVFTPNGDGHNDVFTFFNIGYKDLHCDIYNRWGNHIYSWDDVKGGWNGDTPAGPASDGTYYYVMNATLYSDRVTSSHGWVQLMRH